MTSTDLATVDRSADLIERVVGNALTPAEDAALRRVVKLRSGQQFPTREEFALMLREADHLSLDVFAGQCYFINFGDVWQCYPHWSGLIKIASDTGEYGGMDGPYYSGDGQNWTDAWTDPKPPEFCKVVVFRTGRHPTSTVVRYSRHKKATPYWNGNPEEALAKTAVRLAHRRAFPKEADRPLSPKQLKALHTIASQRGLGGDENRESRLLETSGIVGRPVESFTDLSAAEAVEVMDAWIDVEEVAEEVAPASSSLASGASASTSAESTGVAGEAPRDSAASPQGSEGLSWGDVEPGAGDEGKARASAAARPADAGPTSEGRRPPPAPAPSVSPEELAALRQLAQKTYRASCSADPKRWRPWWRNACLAIRPDGYEAFPAHWDASQLQLVLDRFGKEESLTQA